MFLQSLTLKGFKSFAQTAVIDFAPGVSVIVGPNGSGKSNVVDAISWALGSQAPSTLRSQQMDDVIFAGNPGRPALGRAEVTLTLHNADRRLPVDLEEVAISRTLFRSGDSSYAVNAVPARLGDIAELLAAAGVGRHRHVIVSQGRIDAVLSAKPAERRAILEEAAGVSAFRLRKEKAQRRLADTEANLTRLGDQLREVRRTLGPLEQQATTARRHGELAAELEALQIYLLATELRDLRRRRRHVAAQRRDLVDRRAATARRQAELEERITGAEAQLSATGHMELAEAQARLGTLGERVREVHRALEEKQRALQRRREERMAGDVVASLSSEAARIEVALAEARATEAALDPERARAAAAAEVLDADAAVHAARWETSVGVADPLTAAQLRGRLQTLRDVLGRAETEDVALDERQRFLARRRQAAAEEVGRLEVDLGTLRAAEAAAAEALEEAGSQQREADAAETAARRAQAEAQAEHAQWQSRVEALALAMGDLRARSGMEVLSVADGVLGALGDLVVTDEGWEAAFEAAAGEALAAAVVEGSDAARPALAALAQACVAGAVLPALHRGADPPPVGEPLRPHVRSRHRSVEKVLDGLVGAVAVVADWQEACDAVLGYPDAVVVTPAGDCFSRTGWRVGVTRSGATGEALEESRGLLKGAAGALTSTERAVAEAAAAAAVAAAAHAAASGAHREVARRLAGATGRVTDAERSRAALDTETDTAGTRLEQLRTQLSQHREDVDAATAQLAEMQASEDAAAAASRGARADLERRRAALAQQDRSLDVRAEAARTRCGMLTERLEEIGSRLAGREAEVATAAADERRSAALGPLAETLSTSAQELQADLERLRGRQRRVTEALRVAATRLGTDRRRRAELAAEAAEAAEELLGVQRAEDELGLRIEAAAESLRTRHECDEVSATAAPVPTLPEGVSASQRIRQLQGLLRRMGLVNPLAVREYDNLRERHDLLASQVDDIRSSRRNLNKVIRAVDADITETFSRCYSAVAESFAELFAVLFDGGTGRLRLTEPDDPLNSGVEIEARPAGKNLRRLALLSGGERSLAALAFLFAIFRTQHSPFYVLDEVDAALDDVNLHRFLRLVEEFRGEAQLVLVSHQKPTMEIADCLFGVTMRSGGTSRVISERRGDGAEPVTVAATEAQHA